MTRVIDDTPVSCHWQLHEVTWHVNDITYQWHDKSFTCRWQDTSM